MKILAVFDGSDDGLAGLRKAASLLRAQHNEVTAALVGWPPRRSPIWDRAFSKHPIVDDLHRAMAEVAAAEFERLKRVFEPLGTVKTEYLEGDPVSEIVGLIRRLNPDLLLAGLTRGIDAESVTASAFAILRQSAVPAIMTFGDLDGLQG